MVVEDGVVVGGRDGSRDLLTPTSSLLRSVEAFLGLLVYLGKDFSGERGSNRTKFVWWWRCEVLLARSSPSDPPFCLLHTARKVG